VVPLLETKNNAAFAETGISFVQQHNNPVL